MLPQVQRLAQMPHRMCSVPMSRFVISPKLMDTML